MQKHTEKFLRLINAKVALATLNVDLRAQDQRKAFYNEYFFTEIIAVADTIDHADFDAFEWHEDQFCQW